MMKALHYLFDYTQRVLCFGVYSFQTYSVLQILGAAPLNQGESNTRDHLHGSAGVLALGHSFTNPGNTRQTLTDATTVVWNLNLGSIATLTASGGSNSRTLITSNVVDGTAILHFYQSNSGTNTLSLSSSFFKFNQGAHPSWSSVASKHDICTFICDSGGPCYTPPAPLLAQA